MAGPAAADAQNHTRSVTAAGARRWRAVAALAVVALTAGAIAVWKAAPAPDQLVNATVSAFAIHLQPGQQLPIDTGLPVVLAISPDGQQVAYAARDVDGDRLYLRRRNELEASPIPGTEGAIGPFFSPDGQSIGFGAGGFLKRYRWQVVQRALSAPLQISRARAGDLMASLSTARNGAADCSGYRQLAVRPSLSLLPASITSLRTCCPGERRF